MRACAERLVGDVAAAEEIVQDVFVQLVRRGGSFRGDSSVATWLVTMTLNRARSYRRGSVFRFARRAETLDPHIADPALDPLSRLETRERRECLARALASLSPPAREILALRYGAELSYDELAAALRCAPGTVASRLHRALEQLGRALRERGWSDEVGGRQ